MRTLSPYGCVWKERTPVVRLRIDPIRAATARRTQLVEHRCRIKEFAAKDERARMYHDLVDEVLSEAASRRLEELMTMTYEYQGRIARKYVEQGREEATAASILTVLGARRLVVSDEQRARIESCRDMNQLETWLKRAIDAAMTADIFD
ncbi:hypothetical protein ACFWM1_32800 [Nocardia sp. NPDC058379]|uniref:hypothetical protein n=1 Tax=unclassified Nocardia TaxID=2637762 RepID=UPI00365D25AD